MPRTPVDYSKTIIYKLVHKEDNDNVNIYIGSTTDFRKRKNNHKRGCTKENNKEYDLKKNQYIRVNGGWDNWIMVEVEKFPCNDGNEARAREEHWRSHFNSQLNAIRAYRTEEQKKEQKKERYEQNKDKRKERYENNKDKILEQRKERYENNKDKILEQQKEYNEQHKDKILEQRQEHYKQNKDKILEKLSQQITCECGCIIRKSYLTRHRQSQKHLLLNKQIKYEFVEDSD